MGTSKQLDSVTHDIRSKCDAVMNTKGKDYSGEADRYREFKETAEFLGINKYEVLLVHLNKQYRGLVNRVKNIDNDTTNGTGEIESLESRVIDIMNYLCLLLGMADEDKKNKYQLTIDTTKKNKSKGGD